MSTLVSKDFSAVTAAHALQHAHQFAQEPKILEQIRGMAARAAQDFVPPQGQIEPSWDADDPRMAAIEQALDEEITAAVEDIRLQQGPNPQSVQEYLARFEVLPPAQPEVAQVEELVTQVEAPSLEGEGISSQDLLSALDDDLGFDGLTEDDDLSLDDELDPEADPAVPPPLPDEGRADIDAILDAEEEAADREMRERALQRLNEGKGEPESDADADADADVNVKVKAASEPSMPVQSAQAYVPASATAAAIGSGAEVVGAILASPARMLMGAARSLARARQREAAQRQGVLAGQTLQALTSHNVTGMEKSIADLRDAREALMGDPQVKRALDEIAEAAQDSHKEPQAIIKEMRVGGKYEFLGNKWDALTKSSAAFARFDAVSSDLVRRMGRDQPKLGNTSADLMERYQKSVQEGVALSAGIPSRRALDGEMLESLHQKLVSFGELVAKVFHKIREYLTGRSAESDAPSPGA